jgi:hypothetical protein
VQAVYAAAFPSGGVLETDQPDFGSKDDRTHLGLDKQTPAGRARSREKGTVICQQRVGGLHHRYD